MTKMCPHKSEGDPENFAHQSALILPATKVDAEESTTVTMYETSADNDDQSSQRTAEPLHADVVIEGLDESSVLHQHPPSPVLSVDQDTASVSPASSITPSCECDGTSRKCLCFDDLSLDGSPLDGFEGSTEQVKLPKPPDRTEASPNGSFMTLRLTYLLVTLVIMLADGLQGTHLYVLYESYGFSVAWLYCLGFATGGLMSPITGPLVDKIGRKKSAILYCVLEIFINMLEQYPFLTGLIASRMIGGLTTNLLNSVFETWLDTEYRKRGFATEKYVIIMRDSVVVSNLAAILSGCLAHVLAEHYGAIGPFRGAVTCTAIALVVVCCVWTENYGTDEDEEEGEDPKQMISYLSDAAQAFRKDRRMLLAGTIQGFTDGTTQIFVFLWSPTLRLFSKSALPNTWGLDKEGEPDYGFIFALYMAAGVLGGICAPLVRQAAEHSWIRRGQAVEFITAGCYFISGLLFIVPFLCSEENTSSFSRILTAFLVYEFLIGVFLPYEGVIRSVYFPANARASIMALPRIIVNAAVAIGVVSTNFVTLQQAFLAVGCLMLLSTALQASLIPAEAWQSFVSDSKRLLSSSTDTRTLLPDLRRLSEVLSVHSITASPKKKSE